MAVPERFQVNVEKDDQHPNGRMNEQDYKEFKDIRSKNVEWRMADLMQVSDGLTREELKNKIKNISAQATKDAKQEVLINNFIKNQK